MMGALQSGMRLQCIFLCAFALACAPPSTTDADDEPTLACTPAVGCEDAALPDQDVLMGWSRQTNDQTRIYASDPAVACGNEMPGLCTECGSHRALDIELPPDLGVGIYDIAAGEAHTSCTWNAIDCNSGGGGFNEGDDMQGFVEILSVSETCIVGTISEGDRCSSRAFAASRCD